MVGPSHFPAARKQHQRMIFCLEKCRDQLGYKWPGTRFGLSPPLVRHWNFMMVGDPLYRESNSIVLLWQTAFMGWSRNVQQLRLFLFPAQSLQKKFPNRKESRFRERNNLTLNANCDTHSCTLFFFYWWVTYHGQMAHIKYHFRLFFNLAQVYSFNTRCTFS